MYSGGNYNIIIIIAKDIGVLVTHYIIIIITCMLLWFKPILRSLAEEWWSTICIWYIYTLAYVCL